ncbi:MAG: glucose-6-phosphate isomerase, partial [Clostridia bacterium]|nr:glucose-6-phosphate isomerase [Clostridia bacterium]
VIKALDKEGPEILYAGNTLSAYELSRTLARLEGKRVYMNVIAKNFETLEPGSHFRVLRDWLGRSCPKGELADRIVLTGTRGSRLNEIALEHGYTFFDFPTNIGGRYSAHSAVGLFPMAVAGVDIRALLRGAERMAQSIRLQGENSAACQYAVIRNALYGAGFSVDMLCAFEPRLRYFMKWFVQLIGESEGKENRGFFPAGCIYSEDLHSMGQYVQEGRRNLMETFLTVEDAGASLPVPPDPDFRDGFDYLDGMDFAQINLAAQEASIRAHAEGGVPVMRVCVPRLDEEAFGALFYFFEFGCALSGLLAGINPFDQPGVEAYKQRMFQTLGKKENGK